MRFISTVVVVLLLLVGELAAQPVHPCDAPMPTNQTIASGAPHKVQFCSLQSEQIEALVAYVDGVAFDLLPVTAVGAPSATGYVLYDSPSFLQVLRGAHTIEVAVYNRDALTDALQMGERSAPFAFGAVDPTPRPSAPQVKRVTR